MAVDVINREGGNLMNNYRFITFIILGVLLLGFALAGCVALPVEPTKMVEHTYTITDSFGALDVRTYGCDVFLRISQDGTCTVLCQEAEANPHDVTVKDGVLTVSPQKNSETIFNPNNETFAVTISLPQTTYNRMTIQTSSGDVKVPEDFSFTEASVQTSSGDLSMQAKVEEKLSVKTSSGDLYLEGLAPKSLDASSSSGDMDLARLTGDQMKAESSSGKILLDGVVLSGELSVKTSSGDVQLKECDAAEIRIVTSSGDVKGNLLSGKVFKTKTSSGKMDVTSTEGGLCEIQTSSGDVSVTTP